MKRKLVYLFFLFFSVEISAQLPKGFVYVNNVDASIQYDLRYCNDNNFVGQPIEGYEENVLIVTKEAANALKKIQIELKKKGMSLKIFDAYRPQRAVNHFRKWARNLSDTIKKVEFYPNVLKKNLFIEEYISTRSRHSSGSSVDVTIVDLITYKELDMGTSYDDFGKESWVLYQEITELQKENRKFLKFIMKKYGFRNYPQEWWHFTLRAEPFRDQYFDFVVK